MGDATGSGGRCFCQDTAILSSSQHVGGPYRPFLPNNLNDAVLKRYNRHIIDWQGAFDTLLLPMDLTMEPLKDDELDELISIYWAAFEPISANMYFPMLYPNGLEVNVISRIRNRIQRTTNGDIPSHCFCARDRATGEIVGVSWWGTVASPPKTAEEAQELFKAAYAIRNDGPPVEGFNAELDYAAFHAAFFSETEVVKGEPYMTLRLLAVSPKHHRRGAGSLLLRHGLERADEAGLPVYLATGANGKALYERHGFVFQKDMPLNCLEYGGRSTGQHWCMLRPARGGK